MRLLAALLFLTLIQTPARATDDDRQAYVVLVGIDKYQDSQILPRKHAEADAKALYDVFTSKNHMALPAKDVRLLLGTADPERKSQEATRANVLDAIKWAATNANKEDLVVIALFGEGGPLGDRTCFFTSDSTFKGRSKNALDAAEIKGALSKIQSQRFAVFLDVNYKGFDSGKDNPPELNLKNLYSEWVGKDDPEAPVVGRVLFLSNNGLKPSLDLKDRGAFGKVLADGLKGKADTEGYEGDGLITVSELAKYLRTNLADLNRTTGTTKEQKEQRPIILKDDKLASDFVLGQDAELRKKTENRVALFLRKANNEKAPKDILEEGKTLLSRMPRLLEQQKLRQSYQKLADGKLAFEAFLKDRKTILARMKLSDRKAGEYAVAVTQASRVIRKGYVQETNQGQLIQSAVKGLYEHLDEPVPQKVKDDLAKVKGMKEVDLMKLLTDARKHLGSREDLSDGKDVTYSLHAMMGKLDRHTDYIDPETVRRLETDTTGEFTGIGVLIRANESKNMLQVVTPIRGSPAYKAKIYAGDIITHIVKEVDANGKPLPKVEKLSTKGMTTEDAVKNILGKEGTKVKLIVEREGVERPLEFNLLRGHVEVETVLGSKRKAEDDSWDFVIDPDNRICYVRLTQFSTHTARDLRKAMEKLAKEGGIKGFILDLRFNPGGLLDSAVRITDLFIDDGMIVTIKPRVGTETSYVGTSRGSYTTFPMVCLVNGFSASGSEIVAAALQDHDRAIIMGTRSYGKGSVQTIIPFPETGGKLKITTATFWRPNGRNLNKASTKGKDEDEWGVSPDKGYEVKLPTKELYDLQEYLKDSEIIARPGQSLENEPERLNFRDRQLERALQFLRGQVQTAGKGLAKKAG
jgi:C-terminal peptidase prc